MGHTCHPACAKAVGDVEATCMGIDIQDFACKVEARDLLALQGLGIDLPEVDSALGHKGPCQGHLACDWDGQFFELVYQGLGLTGV